MSLSPVSKLLEMSNLEIGRIIEELPVWVQVCALDGTIELVNSCGAGLSGYAREEMIGQTWPYPWLSGPWEEGASDPFCELPRSGGRSQFEGVCRTKPGPEMNLELSLSLLRDERGQPQRVLLVAWDLTQRKSNEADLSQAQKIQAVSQLASGVAHDINNNLAVILGYAEFLLSTSESFGDVVRQALTAIQEQSIECANTVRRIQLFSRTVSPSQFTSLLVNEVVQEVVETARYSEQRSGREPGQAVNVRLELGAVPAILGYQSGLREALLSVVQNAMEALPAGGIVTCRTQYRERDNQVVIQVVDNGPGIPPVHANRVFDAFFTTKGPASSGLGLSIAHNLITQQGGAVSIQSREEQGTTCTITLPAELDHQCPESILPEVDAREVLSVLVVDDEPLVADVFRAFLESAGHRAVTCLNGTYALQLFQREDFDLAVVDLGMPNMDGWEFSRQIHQISPAFPIIVATGWNVSLEDGNDHGVSVQAVLKKPFGKQELTQAIDQAMEHRRLV